jgi:hypothetical protein
MARFSGIGPARCLEINFRISGIDWIFRPATPDWQPRRMPANLPMRLAGIWTGLILIARCRTISIVEIYPSISIQRIYDVSNGNLLRIT